MSVTPPWNPSEPWTNEWVTPSPPWWVMANRDDLFYRQAACAGAPVDLFFPDPTRPDPRRLEQAMVIRAGCLVREACRATGMAEEHGIWGGLEPRERRVLRRKQRGEAA